MLCARLAALTLGLALLSGCSTVGGWFSSGPAAAPPAAACPSAVILRPLAQTAVFAPGAPQQPLGVGFYGILSDVTAKCDRAGDAVRVSLDVLIFGERGPSAAKGDSVDLQYFVAATGPDQAILGKRTYAVRIPIPQDAKRAGVTDHIEQTIPLGGRPPGDIGIVLGFQQSPEAVEFYKHFRGR